MSKLTRTLIIGATLAAMHLVGMTAIAQVQANDEPVMQPPTEGQVGELELTRFRLCWRIHTGDSSARSRVRREAQVPPGGMPLSQASTRTRLSASAVSTCSRWVLASPR